MKKIQMIRSGIVMLLVTLLTQIVYATSHETTTVVVIDISFVAFLVKLGLALWVYLKNPSAKVNKYFGIVFFGQAIWDLGKYVLWQVQDPGIAIIWAKVSYAGYVLSVFMFLMFIWAYLKKKNFFNSTTPGRLLFYMIIILFMIVTLFSGLMVNGLFERPGFATEQYPVWAYDYGPVYTYFFFWFQMVPFFYGLFLFAHKYFRTKRPDKKKQILYVMIGSSFPIIIGIPTGVILPALGIILPPHNNLLTLIMSIFITIGIAKYKFLAIEPTSEKSKGKPLTKAELKRYTLEKGKSYLLTQEDSLHMGYKVVLSYLRQKNYGLIITHRHPETIKKEHGVETTPIVWITDTDTEYLSVDPVDIEQLYQTIKLFCQRVNNPYIIIDGLNYLMLHNNFSKIEHLLTELKETVESSGGVLVVPEEKIDLDISQQRLLENHFIILPYRRELVAQGTTAHKISRRKDYKHILLGFTPVTESLIEELEKENIIPTVITTANIHHHIPPGRLKVVEGDPLSKKILIKAGVGKPGTLVIITMKNDSEAILAINKVRHLTETGIVVTNIDNKEYMPIAKRAGATHVVPSSSIGGQLMSLTLCAPNAVRWIMDSTTLANREIELVDVTLSGKDKLCNKTVVQADNLLGRAANIIAVENEDGLHKIPDDTYTLKNGDKLVLIVNLAIIKKRKPEEIRKSILSGLALKKTSKKHK